MNSRNLARRIALAAATIGFVPLATLCNLAVPAAGADFGQPFPGLAPPLAADRVEFASNWYVRGDLAYAQETYPNIAPGSPSALNTFSAGVGGGYKVNNYFRTDLILDYRSPIHAAGNGAPANCTFQATNPNAPPAVPCGASCAIGGNVISDFDSNQSSVSYRFAWAVMAGVAIAMTDHAQLDVGYRYLDLGPFTGLSSPTGTSVTQRIRANELRVGVRYMID
jgi:opacity protein-like surface antigen